MYYKIAITLNLRTIQSAKLRATWQRFATAQQQGDIETTNSSLDVHLRETREVFGFSHDTLHQAVNSSLPKNQEALLNLKNHQADLPKILSKELENQMEYLKTTISCGEGDPTLPLSRAHGIVVYLVILARCVENVPILSTATYLDVSLSKTTLLTAQTLVDLATQPNNANMCLSHSQQAILNWLQTILLEVTCYYSFMCDRHSSWINVTERYREFQTL